MTAGAVEEFGGGRYAVVGTLGSGSQGETLECVDKREGRQVAVKRFTIRGAKSWKDVELAEREATVLSALSHPSLPRYIEHFEEDGALYLVMERIEGESLAARRKRGAPLSQEQVLRFLTEAAACLRYLHGHAPPIVHRDIKPGNVILRPDGSYCLVDFGSVRDRLKPEGGSTVVGTFGYMAPEQFQGRAAPGSDVYAVAATALTLLSGSEPEDLPHKGLSIDVEAALRGQVDRRLIGALRSMLEPDPERRAASVDAALQQFGLGPGASVAEESPAQAAKRERQARIDADGYGNRRERRAQQFAHKVSERAHRQAEKEAARQVRRAERRARRAAGWHHPGPPVLPGRVLGLLLLIAFQVAKVATFALFQVQLPTLFTILTLVGGTRMYQRGRRMSEIGQTGQRGLERASEHIRHQFLGGPPPREHAAVSGGASEQSSGTARARVAPDRARVSVEADLEDLERDIETEIENTLEEFVDGRKRRR